MKKIIAILLAMVMVIGLVACSNDKKEDTTPTKPSVNEEIQEPTTSEPTVTEPEDETAPSNPETEEDVTEGEEEVENEDKTEDTTTDGENANEEDKTAKEEIEDAKDKVDEAKDKVEKSKENKKEQNDKVDGTETMGKIVVKIEDTSTPDMSFAQAIEVFYKDETYEYYYNCIFSQCIIVTYADGTTETMKEALNNGNITIADLDAHNIGYMKRPVGGLNKVDK